MTTETNGALIRFEFVPSNDLGTSPVPHFRVYVLGHSVGGWKEQSTAQHYADFCEALLERVGFAELLEACEATIADVNTGLPPDGRTIDALTAAIAKAKGIAP